MSSVKIEQFRGFSNFILNNYSRQELNTLIDWKYLRSIILDICGKSLIVLINEKRLNRKLEGKTSEERYKYFDEELCEKGFIYEELKQTYPSIIDDLHHSLNSYFSLLKEIENKFNQDKKKLLEANLIKDENEKICHLSILGDLHGGKAVTKVTTDKSQILYKPRSLENDSFFLKFLEFMYSFQKNEISTYYKFKFIGYTNHGWMEYIEKQPTSKRKISMYYKRLGYLLSIGYLLNISDLHFENILCSSNFPILIDLETIFHTSIYDPEFRNFATKNIEEEASNSVFATGMLPISKKDKKYGGDISGILGGIFNKHERTIINPNRDDIKFQKRLIRVKRNDHIPFYIENGKRKSFSPEIFIEDIQEGFKYGYKLFLDNKKEIMRYIRKISSEVEVRILPRSTIEYSVLIQAAKSPLYANNRESLFSKLEKYGGDLLNSKLISSEIKQIKTLSVPYFYTKVQSVSVKDIENNTVHYLPKNPLNVFLEKTQRYSLKDLLFQCKLISFSLESQDKLFINGKKFINYEYEKSNLDNIDNAIDNLVNIIIDSAVIDEIDGSVNWMNLGISKEEEIIFESLSDDIYKGLSGIGIALLKYYETNKNLKDTPRLIRILRSIYSSILSDLSINSSENKDLSFFNGEMGKIAFLYRYQIKFERNCDMSKKYMKSILDSILTSEFELNDIIAGLPGIISYLYNQEIFSLELVKMGDKLLEGLDSNLTMASYAHGKSGLIVSLLYLYDLTKEKKYLVKFYEEWKKENTLKLKIGWKDLRQDKDTYSVSWCHGVTGQLISRLVALEINDKTKIFNTASKELIQKEIDELLCLLKEEGLDQNNFCLCHGVMGNLWVLNYYQKKYESTNIQLKNEIESHFCSVANFGLNKGWICGLGDHFYSFSIMTGISGILYAFSKYKAEDNELGILLPNV
ncbi:type 2 lanthipeptide synthetase LanM family protein [Staphylococcus sp. SQ8-PEA]|uniref:Type 2 lanthipeptide synthetase LanM family protein n=1 Tax=Staphylococcus marylandisciuri TaxID=2981529 RepID=A0ABT2QR67_9STAP|nr:type 2 lanthipeptide synthetase LanM family protein [Staphylococcus marylandisciuri]MCU5746467.1 type 2 lanthipeptide synthetase LanM family protein [Staphylococcus marylandisciuri]